MNGFDDWFWADVYVLVDSRSRETAERFLDTFLPDREENTSEFEIPRHSENPETVLPSARELMEYCESRPHIHHGIYWSNAKDRDPRTAMVFYTNDGKMILGLSVSERECETPLLSQLKEFSGSDLGYIVDESPPPDNSREFTKEVEAYRLRTQRRTCRYWVSALLLKLRKLLGLSERDR